MKVLVLGGNGMAGHQISLYLKEKGIDVTVFSLTSFPHCKNIMGNALELEAFVKILENFSFDVVINCIGLLNQDAENNLSQAIYLNSFLPHFLADFYSQRSTKLIHMSTDCVFKGNTGPYFEDSFPDGDTFYDRTKALGELKDSKNLTFRESIIGPDINPNGIGLFNWFMKQEKAISGYKKAMWTGVTTLTLAKAMLKAIEENLSGVYNLVNNESISKYDLLCLFNKHFRNNEIEIWPNLDVQIDKSLKNTRNDFSFRVPMYDQMVIEMKDWIMEHKELYPNYFK